MVEKSLKGQSLEQALGAQTYDGILIKPLYDENDHKPTSDFPLAKTNQRGVSSTNPRPSPRPWQILQLIDHPDLKAANAQLKQDLSSGADGALLALPSPMSFGASSLTIKTEGDIKTLLAGCDLTDKSLHLTSGPTNLLAATALLTQLPDLMEDPSTLRGSLGFDPLSLCALEGQSPKEQNHLAPWIELVKKGREQNLSISGFTASGRVWQQAGASEAQELAYIIASALAYARALNASGLSITESFAAIDLSLTVTSEIFLSIAKCRALRLLWQTISEASGAKAPLHIRAEMSYLHQTKHAPEMNMLRATACAIGAGTGTADSLVLVPYTSADTSTKASATKARRYALNTQLIAQEESHIGKVEDPAAGAWYIESLTEALCNKAWSIFQQSEQAGGLLNQLQDGTAQKAINDVWQARKNDFATGKTPLIGVTLFPNLEEKRSEAAEPSNHASEDAPSTSLASGIARLSGKRLAEDIEKLRNQSDAIKQQTGQRPHLFLANWGKRADFSARAGWVKNIFEAGGIKVQNKEGWDNLEALLTAYKAAPTPLVCLCSSDERYESDGAQLLAALKDQGAAVFYIVAEQDSAAVLKDGQDVPLIRLDQTINRIDLLKGAHQQWASQATEEGNT